MDGVDPQDGKILAVASLLAVAFAAFEFENDHFAFPAVGQDGGIDGGPRYQRLADMRGAVIAQQQHPLHGYGGARLACQKREFHLLPLLHPNLPAGVIDNRVHQLIIFILVRQN